MLLIQFDVGGNRAFKIDQNSVARDFGTYFAPTDPPNQYLIDAASGNSKIIIRWLDNSSDTTTPTQIIVRIEVDQFTPVQANAAPVNSSLLTYR